MYVLKIMQVKCPTFIYSRLKFTFLKLSVYIFQRPISKYIPYPLDSNVSNLGFGE